MHCSAHMRVIIHVPTMSFWPWHNKKTLCPSSGVAPFEGPTEGPLRQSSATKAVQFQMLVQMHPSFPSGGSIMAHYIPRSIARCFMNMMERWWTGAMSTLLNACVAFQLTQKAKGRYLKNVTLKFNCGRNHDVRVRARNNWLDCPSLAFGVAFTFVGHILEGCNPRIGTEVLSDHFKKSKKTHILQVDQKLWSTRFAWKKPRSRLNLNWFGSPTCLDLLVHFANRGSAQIV